MKAKSIVILIVLGLVVGGVIFLLIFSPYLFDPARRIKDSAEESQRRLRESTQRLERALKVQNILEKVLKDNSTENLTYEELKIYNEVRGMNDEEYEKYISQ